MGSSLKLLLVAEGKAHICECRSFVGRVRCAGCYAFSSSCLSFWFGELLTVTQLEVAAVFRPLLCGGSAKTRTRQCRHRRTVRPWSRASCVSVTRA